MSLQDRKSGYTALHFAVELPQSDRVTANTHIIKMMLECPGVDARHLLKIANYAGNTPLHVIAGRDFDEDHVVKIIDLLMSFGADIDLKNLEKQSPRDLAIVKKKERPKVRFFFFFFSFLLLLFFFFLFFSFFFFLSLLLLVQDYHWEVYSWFSIILNASCALAEPL